MELLDRLFIFGGVFCISVVMLKALIIGLVPLVLELLRIWKDSVALVIYLYFDYRVLSVTCFSLS